MKNGIKILIAINVILAGVVVYALFIRNQGPRVAYIQSDKVIYGFYGTIEAQNKFKEEVNLYQANYDSLEIEYQKKVNELNSLTGADKIASEKSIDDLYLKIEDYRGRIEQMLQQREMELTQTSINQINSFVTKYGKAKGYDVILGTGSGGSILYGNESLDITEDFLKSLNEEYYAGVDTSSFHVKENEVE